MGDALRPREREVAGLIGMGLSNRAIADLLCVSERTVETHARNIRERLGLCCRASMVDDYDPILDQLAW